MLYSTRPRSPFVTSRIGAGSALLALTAVIAILIASAVTPNPASATTYGQHYGVVDQWGGDGSGTGPMDVIMQNLGAKWIRAGWDWDKIEGPGDNQYDPMYLSLMDNFTSQMNAIGVSMFHNFNYTPAWARTGGDQRTPPNNPAKYTEYITFMVNRYKGSIHHWGFWNEVNIAPFWTGDYNWYISNLLIPGIAAVKAADPTAKTVVGELSTSGDDVGKLRTMLLAIDAAGLHDQVDVISHHSYDGGDTASGRLTDMDTLRAMIVSIGWGEKDFWCTETGIQSSGTNGETRQANMLMGLIQGMDARPWWKKLFWYTLTEGSAGGFGLLKPDSSPKPSYTQYQAYIAEHADDAEIVSDTIPATMVAGRQYYVSVSTRNTGTVNWQESQQYKLGGVNDSDPFAGTRQNLNTGETVATDAIKTFWFTMTAPSATGTYTTDWQMVHDGVHWFGHSLVKTVTVNNGPDTVAPGAPSAFTATRGDQSVTLSWTNPTDADCAGIVIRRKTGGYPTSRTDGALVLDRAELAGQPDSVQDTGLTNDTAYYYAIYARDPVPNYSSGANVTGTPTDLTPPGPVSSLSALEAFQQVTLSWQNPSDSDFAGTMVRCKMSGYPTGIADGTLVIDKSAAPGSSDGAPHMGLMIGGTYYYRAFSRDSRGNYNALTSVTASGTTGSATLWLVEPFDSYSDGSLSGQGNWTSAVLDSQVQSTVANPGKALILDSIAAAGTITNNYAGFAKRASGTQIVSFDVAQSYTGTSATAFGGVPIYADDSTEIARFTCVAGSWRLEYGSGSVSVLSATAAQNTWYTIKLVFDLAQRKISASVNGASKATNLSFKTGSGSSIARVGVTSSLVSGLTAQKMYFDNLRGETSPASPTAVTDDGAYTGSLSTLHCSWTSGGPSAVEYQYAIGTTIGGSNIVGWTNVGSATEVTKTGLSLSSGATYYFAVQAGNGYGSWTSSVNSNGIKTPSAAVSIQGAKALADGSVSSDNKAIRSKLVSAAFPGYFYIQEPNGHYGLKVLSSAGVSPGYLVDIAGLMKGANSERYMDCTPNVVTVTVPNPIAGPYPVSLTNAAVGGTTLNVRTPGVAGSLGPNNIGLLVVACGKVTQRKTTDPKYFYIDDGCALADGTTTGSDNNIGLRIVADPASYAAGSYVAVTGISSCFLDGGVLKREILPVSIQILNP
jgi:hypothetical protein